MQSAYDCRHVGGPWHGQIRNNWHDGATIVLINGVYHLDAPRRRYVWRPNWLTAGLAMLGLQQHGRDR